MPVMRLDKLTIMIQTIGNTRFTFLTELVQLTASFAIQLDELKDKFLNLVQDNQVCAFWIIIIKMAGSQTQITAILSVS